MAVYEMLKLDGTPFTDGACGLYNSRSDFADFGEILDDDVARGRGIIQPDGFPLKGWIWFPGPAASYRK